MEEVRSFVFKAIYPRSNISEPHGWGPEVCRGKVEDGVYTDADEMALSSWLEYC